MTRSVTRRPLEVVLRDVIWDAQWHDHIDDLVQDCSNSSALAMELLQSCAEH